MVVSLKVVAVDVNPNQCKLTEPLNLDIMVDSLDSMEVVATVSLVLDIAHVRLNYFRIRTLFVD